MKEKAKKILTGISALSLVAVAAVGGTIAYLTDITEQRANNFTFASDSLDAMLTEPEWDGVISYEYTDDDKLIPIYEYKNTSADPDNPNSVPVYGYENGDKSKPVTNIEEIETKKATRPRTDSTDNTYKPEYGDEQAMNMIPGQSAKKNPFITNTGEVDEWVASKITFVYAENTDNAGKQLSSADWDKVKDVIVIDYDSDDTTGTPTWIRAGGESSAMSSQTFYYNILLEVDAETIPIFENVKVKNDATNEQMKALEDMGGFAIWIEGYAAQDISFENGNAWTTSNSAKFENTPTTDKGVNVAKPGYLPAKNNMSPNPNPES